MPELPEVERAAALIRSLGTGKRIEKVETTADPIVFSGMAHEDFATEITGRTIMNASRFGKVFYLELDGEGKMPVFHFGMTGMLQVKGELATYYKETPKSASTDWPPRFMKFILHLSNDASGNSTQLAFMDARRLARIRLCASPPHEHPISDLGFDPILSMPSLERFQDLTLGRSCTVKTLLLDQSFSAGVGNWVADEILYNARIHPEQKCNTLTADQLVALHHHTADVPRVAVAVNADDSKFPEHWLFKHRWGIIVMQGKGKKEKHTLKLPSGEPATIKWSTVGGRTSAYVVELQHLPTIVKTRKVRVAQQVSKADDEGELTARPESGSDPTDSRKRKSNSNTSESEPSRRRKITQEETATTPSGGKRRAKARAAKKK